MNRGIRRYIAFILMIGFSCLAACSNPASPTGLISKSPEKTLALDTVVHTSSPSILAQSPTPSPTASPVPVIAAGTKPFLPINILLVSDNQSVYYQNATWDSSYNVSKRDLSTNKITKLESYGNPIHQIFLDYDHNLYYFVCGYTEDSWHTWLYKYSNGKAVLLLSDIEEVCGINDRYLYFTRKTDGENTLSLCSYDLASAATTPLFYTNADESYGFFSSSEYIYYGFGNELRSYDTKTGTDELILDSVYNWYQDIMNPNYVYLLEPENEPDSITLYDIHGHKIVRTFVHLPVDCSNISCFYLDGDIINVVTSDFDTQKSTLCKIDSNTMEVLKKAEINGYVQASVIYGDKWYLYSDVRIDSEKTGYAKIDKKIGIYNFSDEKIKVFWRTKAFWVTDGDEDGSIGYLEVADGYLYGYYYVGSDNGYYFLCLLERLGK